MRGVSLTERGGGSCTWRGREVPVNDDARNMIRVVLLFQDDTLQPHQKWAVLQRMLWPDPDERAAVLAFAGADAAELLDTVLWDMCGIDVTGRHADMHEPPVFDWEQDAARIEASVMQAYGVTWDELAAGRTYAEVCDLLGVMLESGEDTPFREAVHYRTAKPPKATKWNREEVRQWHRLKRHYALSQRRGDEADAMEAENRKAADMFAALRRRAESGWQTAR